MRDRRRKGRGAIHVERDVEAEIDYLIEKVDDVRKSIIWNKVYLVVVMLILLWIVYKIEGLGM